MRLAEFNDRHLKIEPDTWRLGPSSAHIHSESRVREVVALLSVPGGCMPEDSQHEASHFTVYSGRRQRGPPRSASREAEGPAL